MEADTLTKRLEDIEDPLTGETLGSLELVTDVSIEDETAKVSLALNTPYSPTEGEIGDAVREVISDAGLEPDLTAAVGREQGFDEDILPSVRNVIAVASGKGGVGKTTVAANLAAGLERRGAFVGLLDADVHGPNAPRILPVEGEPGVTAEEDEIVPPQSDGVKVMSMSFLLHHQDDPAIMRGPMVNHVMTHFLENVEWGYLDYLVVDLPPGTGDASINLLQTLPVTGTVIVTTPQQMALDDAVKGLRLFEKHNTPVLGVVENMATFQCPTCEDEHAIFGHEGAVDIVEEYDVPLLGQLPVHPDYGADGTEDPVVKSETAVQAVTEELVVETLERVGAINRLQVREADPTSVVGTTD